jgi:uncharacterized protein (DUF302 family)
MTEMTTTGVVDLRSPRSVAETMDHLESLVRARGVKVFARIDFSGDAASAGLSMRPMQMLIFGNPKGGTPLLQASPRAGLDLPLKALAWQDANDATWLSFNAASYIGTRHGLSPELVENIAGLAPLLDEATK